MGGITPKEARAHPLGTKDQTDALLRNGRSIYSPRSMVGVVYEDISNLTAEQIPLPTAAVEMEVVSTSADDTLLGIGVQQVIIVCLNEEFREVNTTIPLDGQTPVDVASGVRINTFISFAVGTSRGGAVGTITIRDKNAPATIFAQMVPGENTMEQTLFTVPQDTTVSIIGWSAMAVTVAKTVRFRLQTTDTLAPGVFTTRDIMCLKDNILYKSFSVPFVLPERADIIVNAKTLFGGGTSDGEASYQLFIQR